MANDKWSPQPYSNEELLSFDRLKRAVIGRVLNKAETLIEEEFPIRPERISELIDEEWQRAKQAVRVSPVAREAFRKYLENLISDQVDNLIKVDKEELRSLGMAEKSL